MESALRLHRHEPGTLTALDRYLLQRTGGMIGSLPHLIRAAVITAISEGSEMIDRACWTASRSTTPRSPPVRVLPDIDLLSVPLAPLPCRTVPCPMETTESYIRRLAQANHIDQHALRRYIAAAGPGRPSQPTGSRRYPVSPQRS